MSWRCGEHFPVAGWQKVLNAAYCGWMRAFRLASVPCILAQKGNAQSHLYRGTSGVRHRRTPAERCILTPCLDGGFEASASAARGIRRTRWQPRASHVPHVRALPFKPSTMKTTPVVSPPVSPTHAAISRRFVQHLLACLRANCTHDHSLERE